jgi:SOS-response transcriptional repressor LexA
MTDRYRRCKSCGGIAGASWLPLTTRQHRLYVYLVETIAARGFAPMFSEIAEHFGYRSLASVHELLDHLERKGWIKRRFNVQQSIECLVALDPAPTQSERNEPSSPLSSSHTPDGNRD